MILLEFRCKFICIVIYEAKFVNLNIDFKIMMKFVCFCELILKHKKIYFYYFMNKFNNKF